MTAPDSGNAVENGATDALPSLDLVRDRWPCGAAEDVQARCWAIEQMAIAASDASADWLIKEADKLLRYAEHGVPDKKPVAKLVKGSA